jgi:Transposase, Mutator family
MRWSKRDLSAKRYAYFWVDGIHVQARLEADAQCLLVIIGATPEGKKELVGLTDGVRESTRSWKELLLDLKRRGLSMGPELAVADGALASGKPSKKYGHGRAAMSNGGWRATGQKRNHDMLGPLEQIISPAWEGPEKKQPPAPATKKCWPNRPALSLAR